MDFIALTIAPGLAICLYLFHEDAYNREPKLNMIVSFVLGLLCFFPVYIIENYFYNWFPNTITGIALRALLVVAFVEESFKFLILRFYAYRLKSFDEPFDGIVYAVMVSMGFATIENFSYVNNFAQLGRGYEIAFLRMFLSVPAHGVFAVLMGYYVGKAKFIAKHKIAALCTGLLLAILYHGVFDTLLLWQQSKDLRNYVKVEWLFIGAVLCFLIALRVSWIFISRLRLTSQQTYMPTASLQVRRAYQKDIPLIRKLSEEVWPQTYASILSQDQINYMFNLMYSEEMLSKQMKEKNEFVIVYDGRVPVGFASFGLLNKSIYKLHKIYILQTNQRKGTGKFLLEAIIKAVERKGGKTLQLNVNRNNTALHFYSKLGFSIIREEDIAIGEGYFMNDYVMEKSLE